MAAINAYLNFPGTTEKAFDFYRSVFGGQFTSLVRFGEMPFGASMSAEEQQKLMHVALPAGGMTLMGTDALASQGHTVTMGPNISLMLATQSIEESDHLFAALSAGGKIETPMERSPWGSYYGAFTDQFGIRWMVNCDLK